MTNDAPDVQFHPGWRNALDLFERADFTFGHVLTDEWLRDAFSLDPPPTIGSKADFDRWDLMFLRQFKRFEAELADRLLLVLDRVQGQGYRILHPKVQARRALEKFHHEHVKASRRARRWLSATRLQELTPIEKMEHANAMALVARASGATPRPREWTTFGDTKITPAVMLESRKVDET